MAINLEHPDLLELRKRLRENPSDFVVVVGAGLSRPCGMPSWVELRQTLVQEARSRACDVPPDEKVGYHAQLDRLEGAKDLWVCFSDLKRILGPLGYQSAIKSRLQLKDSRDAPTTYDLLWSLDVAGIVSFNLDDCARQSYSRVRHAAVDVATSSQFERFSQFPTARHKYIFHPHGIVQEPSSWVLTYEELDELLQNRAYVEFMKLLCSTKQLLIMGFDTGDFAFQYVLQRALHLQPVGTLRHFAFIPNPDPHLVQRLSHKNTAVIPYAPDDDLHHHEIGRALETFLKYVPHDPLSSSIYKGTARDPSDLPPELELLAMPLEDRRRLLNEAITYLIPQSRTPTEGDLSNLQQFYKEHVRVINDAWLVEPDSTSDSLYGYKVLRMLGGGAFGKVYEAEASSDHSRVAIKVLKTDIRFALDYLNSFRRGVRSMRILTEHNIDGMVSIREAYEVPACVVMDFIDGCTLEEAIQRNLLAALPDCLTVLVSVAETVHKGHSLPERVLHRDLKPDNIILRDYYSTSDPLDVKVLDFDLSWHRGAILSVVHGERAVGYAAPEQTLTGRRKGVSTRHAGVDVFGLGMVAYFVFVGDHPRGNHQRFADFGTNLRDGIVSRFNPSWKCLPGYLARLVEDCTRDEQSLRISFSAATEALRVARDMTMLDRLPPFHPLLVREVAANVDPDGAVHVDPAEFGRKIAMRSRDGAKEMELALVGDRGATAMHVRLRKVRSAHEQRSVLKYLPQAGDKATSALREGGFLVDRAEIGQSNLELTGRLPLHAAVSRKQLEEVAGTIINARAEMEFHR